MSENRIKITPRARKAAKKLSLSLEGLSIQGTGYDGGICEKDILDYVKNLPEEPVQRVTALAKRIAEMEGVSLEKIQGTGSRNKIRKSDVLAAMNLQLPSEEKAAQEDSSDQGIKRSFDGKEILEEVPYSGVRRVILIFCTKFTCGAVCALCESRSPMTLLTPL